MAKSLGSYSLQFGMVSIPTALHSVASPAASKTGLNMTHASCGSKLKQQYVCAAEGCVVEKDDIARGFEYAKGQMVPVTPQDLEGIPLPSKGTIEITSFCGIDEIDPSRFEGTYVLEPGQGGDRPFSLLARALEAQGLLAIATFCLRQKEQLVAIRYAHGRLFLHPLFYESEMNIRGDGQLPAVTTEKELAMAVALTEQLTQDFDATAHRDRYTEAFGEMIERKLDPKRPAPEAAPAPAPSGIDFMAALEASIAKAKKGAAA